VHVLEVLLVCQKTISVMLKWQYLFLFYVVSTIRTKH